MHAERVIAAIVDWAVAEPTIRAVALIGSHARGTARADSDVDIVVLTTHPQAFRRDHAWLADIRWDASGARLWKWRDEDYGQLWSRRVWLERNSGEIEVGFSSPAWADVNPVDSGTREVIAGGCRILHDPTKILARLCAEVAGSP